MFNFRSTNNKKEFNNKEMDSITFKSKDRYVDEKGQRTAIDYAGHRYQLSAKHELPERFTKRFLGPWQVLRSFGCNLSSKTVQNLFKKDHKSRHFEILDQRSTDFTLLIPKEMHLEILSFLDGIELKKCFRLNKLWKDLASDQLLWQALFSRIGFGKEQWAKFGDIGKEPPLPPYIYKMLKSPCPFFPEKKIEETHLLMLIPETLNGKPLNLRNLCEIIKGRPFPSVESWNEIIHEYGEQSIGKSHWVLMTKVFIKPSAIASYVYNAKFPSNYEIPHLLEASICIFMHYKRSNELLFNTTNDEVWHATFCLEKMGDYPVKVGGFYADDFVSDIGQIQRETTGFAFLRSIS